MHCQRFLSTVGVCLFLSTGLLAQGSSNERVPEIVREKRQHSSQGQLSLPLRDIRTIPGVQRGPREIHNAVKFKPPGPGAAVSAPDPIRQSVTGPMSAAAAAASPAPGLSFEGISDDDNGAELGFRVVPPDTQGDVGPNHFVQMINNMFAVYGKDGTLMGGPYANNAPWTGAGGLCESENDGDPIVLYDEQADRWILSQFAIQLEREIGTNNVTELDGHQCIAVSVTGDPLGAYHLYDFRVSPGKFNDYPKIGVWNNAYYLSANEFEPLSLNNSPSIIYSGPIVIAFEPGADAYWRSGQGTGLQAVEQLVQPAAVPPGGTDVAAVRSAEPVCHGLGQRRVDHPARPRPL